MTTGAPRQRRAPQGLELALALLLFCQAGAALVARFPHEPGLDFYHFWGIGAARKLSAEPLGNPYAGAARYAELLNRAADASRDPHLKRANALRRDPTPGAARLFDPTSTPLAYLVFSALPLDYSAAHALFRALQLAAAAGAIALLLLELGVALPRGLLAAGALALCYRPLAIDWNVGNLNALQLGLAALLVREARRAPRAASREHALWAGLAAFALFKPNAAPIALGLALALAARGGRARALRGACTALAAGALLVAASSLFLGSASAWPDWWSHLRGPGGSKLAAYPIGSGNQSLAALLASASGLPASAHALWLGAALFASAAAALRARPRGARGAPLADPFAAAGLGTLALFAAAPLVWNHYAVLLLLPAAWLLVAGAAAPPACRLGSLLAIALVAGGSDALLGQLSPAFQRARPWLFALAWLPLWLHALAALRAPSPPDAADLRAR